MLAVTGSSDVARSDGARPAHADEMPGLVALADRLGVEPPVAFAITAVDRR